MKKAVYISVFIHLFIILPLLFFLVSANKVQSVTDSVKIKILSRGIIAAKSFSHVGNENTGSLKSKKNFPAKIPETGNIKQSDNHSCNNFPVPEPFNPADFSNSAESVIPTHIPETTGFINDSFSMPDPLEGMEDLIKYTSTENENQNKIKVMWDFSGERGIVFYPEIHLEKKESDSIRITDIKVKIKVSSKGDVLTADVVPPGSGVPAVDRMLYDSALKLIFEPGENKGQTIEGILNIKILSRNTAAGRESP